MYTELTKLKFELMPEKLRPDGYGVDLEDEFLIDIQKLYNNCYLRVFEENASDSIMKHKNAAEIIRESSNLSECSSELFILTNMLAHKTANPDRQFYSNQLLGSYAIKRIALYRDASIESFGHFGFSTMRLLTDNSVGEDSVRESLFDSEVLAGSFILGYKLLNAGSALKAMYAEHELDFNPLWLAIEPTYKSAIEKYIDRDDIATNKHRSNVVRELRALKKKKTLARRAFTMREEIAPRAVQEVLFRRGFQSSFFEYKKDTVTDMFDLWHKVSLAIQHYYCTMYVRARKGYYYRKFNSMKRVSNKREI